VDEARSRAEGGSSRPFLHVSVGGPHVDDNLVAEVAEALRPNFDVSSGRIYSFTGLPPAKAILEFGVALLPWVEAVGVNVFSSAVWDGLKSFLTRGRDPDQLR
jgi:hypothetical protein